MKKKFSYVTVVTLGKKTECSDYMWESRSKVVISENALKVVRFVFLDLAADCCVQFPVAKFCRHG